MVQRSASSLQHSAGMGAEHLARISDDIRSAFNPLLRARPAGLVLMPVDPRQLHAFWSLDDGMLKLSQGKPLVLLLKQLRPADPDDANRLQYEVVLSSSSNQRNVKVPNQAHDYLAEIGYHDKQGRFVSLMQSNRINTSHQVQRPQRAGIPIRSSGSAVSRPINHATPQRQPIAPLGNESEADEAIRLQMRHQGYYSGPPLSQLPSSAPSSAEFDTIDNPFDLPNSVRG